MSEYELLLGDCIIKMQELIDNDTTVDMILTDIPYGTVKGLTLDGWNENSVDTLLDWGQPIDLQGFDIRIFNDEQGEALNQLKHYKSFKFAWDNPKDNLDDKIDLLLNYIRPYKLMCYVLIGYWSTPEEDMNRVMHLVDKYKISPFVMPYNKFDPYQNKFARWVNNKIVFNKVAWEDFEI